MGSMRRSGKQEAQAANLALALAAGKTVMVWAPTHEAGERSVRRAREHLIRAKLEERGTVEVRTPEDIEPQGHFRWFSFP